MNHRSLGHVIRKVKPDLLTMGRIRLRTFLILLLTAVTGWGSSIILLKIGATQMWIRYPVSVVISFIFFFISLRFWISLVLVNKKYRKDIIRIMKAYKEKNIPETVHEEKQENSRDTSGVADIFSEAFGCVFEAEEAGIILMIIIMFFSILGLGIYFIAFSPLLVVELVLSSFVILLAKRNIRRFQTQSWNIRLIAKAFVPFSILAIVLAVCGFILQLWYPDVHTVGDAIKKLFS